MACAKGFGVLGCTLFLLNFMDRTRLIYAEDNEFDAELFTETLSYAIEDEDVPDMEVVHVDDTHKLRDALHQAVADAVPFIVLSDEKMPGGSGAGCIAEVLTDERYEDVDWNDSLINVGSMSGSIPRRGNILIADEVTRGQQELIIALKAMQRELIFISKPATPKVLFEFLNGVFLD